MSLLRLNVCDSLTGICFYEKIWKWSGTSVAEGICKLVLTFHKLSNEIGDTGEVKGVLFEQPIVPSNPLSTSNSNIPTPTSTQSGSGSSTNVRHSLHHRTPSTTGSSSTAKRVKVVNLPPPIRLSCEKEDTITVSVFYEQQGFEDEIRKFILNVLQEFNNKYGSQLPSLRPILHEMSEFPEKCKTKPEEIMQRFKDFEKIADEVRIQSKLI
ncbi:hypothetical protein SAMD00019534_058480, partial [Acytostelium subglobosum LB1]|uniref:hypothetical protein n=1 Tax=Acytostelium subglobosum LB1 TaxID=1410327 RepID=UPI00064489DE